MGFGRSSAAEGEAKVRPTRVVAEWRLVCRAYVIPDLIPGPPFLLPL